jgi:hypothetical protein
MSLKSWAENGWLREEATSPNEIKQLLRVVERDLADAAVDKISTDLRFIVALGAALQAATIPLRASGYRVTVGRGANEHTFDSLSMTAGTSQTTIQMLKTLSRKRNRANYDMTDAISDQELSQILKLATALRSEIVTWLEKNHPDLLK